MVRSRFLVIEIAPGAAFLSAIDEHAVAISNARKKESRTSFDALLV